MVTRVTIGGGEITEQQMPTSKGTVSSADYDAGGVEVRRGPMGLRENIHDKADLNDSDMIVVEGMELSVKHARSLGLLNKAFDEGLSSGNASRAAAEHAEATQAETSEDTDADAGKTGIAQYDDAIDGLNESLEAGVMTMDEAQVYDTITAEVTQSGLSFEHAVETLDGLASGDIAELDVPDGVKTMLNDAQAKITAAAETSAKAELGDDGFAYLQNLASTHPEVNRVVRLYATDRATGQAGDITWSALVADLKQQLGI